MTKEKIVVVDDSINPFSCVEVVPNDLIGVDDFEGFYKYVQENTGYFKNSDKEYYTLYPEQLNWLTLFDIDKPKNRSLLGSRDKGKSEVVTIMGSAYHIYKNPSVRIGIMSFNHHGALKFVEVIKDILLAVGVELIPRAGGYCTTSRDSATPNLKALGLMTTVRGNHFDYLILDDPITTTEEYSNRYMQRSRQYMSEGASISKYIILIGQLLTRDDVYYDAMISDPKNYYVIQSWYGDIPALDKDLKILGASMSNKDIARNYLGKIDDKEEAIFKSIQFDSEPQTGVTYAFIDPSSKGRDYTAIAVGWVRGGKIIVRGHIIKKNWGEALNEIVECCKSCKLVYYEDNIGSTMGRFLLREGVRATPMTTTGNKMHKIYGLKGLVLTGGIVLHTSSSIEAIEQVRDWTELAKYHDLPDAIVMLVIKLGYLTNRTARGGYYMRDSYG